MDDLASFVQGFCPKRWRRTATEDSVEEVEETGSLSNSSQARPPTTEAASVGTQAHPAPEEPQALEGDEMPEDLLADIRAHPMTAEQIANFDSDVQFTSEEEADGVSSNSC